MQLWYQHLPSSLLMQSERNQIDRILSPILGEYLLQMGGPCEFSEASPVRNKIYLAHDPRVLTPGQAGIAADWTQLPVYPGSADVFLLVHALEFVQQPQHLLDEIYQTLAPCGQLIIVGFNSMSLWGLTHLWKKKDHHKPWQGHFYMLWQIKHWLRRTGFQVVNSETFYFRPPVTHAGWDKHWLWLEAAGELCLPGCGSVFILTAQKRERGMTPIKVVVSRPKIVLKNTYAKQITQVKHPS